jgi:two-component system sensor histidine kinase EvgS
MRVTGTALIGWLRSSRRAWLLALVVGLLLPAAAQPERVWRYGMLASYPPFQVWPEPGWPGGADLELLRLAAQRAGGRIEPVRYTQFDRLHEDLVAGRIDVASAVARTPEREPQLAFGPPYARIETVLATRRADGDVPLTADLAGRRIAVVVGYASASQVARLFPQATRVPVPDVASGLRALGEGRADLFIESATVIAETLDQLQLPDLRIARPVELGAGDLHLASGRAAATQLAPLAAALDALGPAERQAQIARWTAVTRVSAPVPVRLSDEDRAQLASLPALRVAVVGGQAPFAGADDGGAPVGLSVDMLAAALARLVPTPPVLLSMDAESALAALREGRVDLALGLPELATRRHGIGFAGPFIAHPLMLAAPRRSGLWSLEQMGGRRLAMPALQVPQTLLQVRYPRVLPVACDTIAGCLARVERGEAEAMVADVVSLGLVLGSGGFGELQLVGTAGDLRHERGVAVSPARRGLVPALQQALDAAVAEDLPALKSRWLDRPPPQRLLREFARRAAPWVGAAVLLLGAIWWWHAAGLRAEVARTRTARSDAERAAAAAQRFVVFLAHEVRNSLHSVIAASELLRGQPGIAPSVTEPLGRSARATLALLNGLLDRERLAAGALTLDPGPVRLPALVASVVEEMAPLAQAAGVTLQPEPMPDRLLRVDALRVQQVLRNLLSNAIKYGGPGVVEIRHAVDLGGAACRVSLTVRDHGPGLDAARLQSAFEPFAGATRGRTDSAGLGLALGRDLARALGGDLTLETAVGGGLCARFDWLAECLETPPPAGATTSRVLVVEDAEVYAMLLRRAFEAAGWQVETAAGVAEARARLEAGAFDLLLTDLHLPDGDAQDVLAVARQSGLRCIVMTADVDAPPDGLRGPDDLVAKGADARLFVARILETVRPAVA